MRRRSRILAGISTAWWAASGIVGATRLHRMRTRSGAPGAWTEALRTELFSALLWVPSTMLALRLTERFPLGRPSVPAVAAHAGGLGVTIAGRAAAVMATNRLVRYYRTVPPARELLLTSTLNSLFQYAMITGVTHAVHYAQAYRVREAQLAEARLEALRGQIRPHFLFNALNTIAAAVRDDPERAEEMIVQLGALLRRSLDTDRVPEVPLRDELDVVRAYLDIEQARFGDRLGAGWAVDPELLDAAVPPLVLQPLVENAVRHGLSPRAAGGRVEVAAQRRGRRLCLRVTDNGVGMSAGTHAPDAGLGLANVRVRLRMLYGPRGFLAIGPAGPDGGTSVEIVLPFQRMPFQRMPFQQVPFQQEG